MEKLNEARARINEIDEKMASLFEERMQAAKVIAGYKKERGLPIFDAVREQALIERNLGFIKDYEISSYYVRFLNDLMAVSKQYQERLISGTKIAYCGIEERQL